MTAFVHKFQNDLFISYAHEDATRSDVPTT